MSNFQPAGSPNDIAIIGMACRLPGAANIQAFWNNLYQGVESISHFTDAELEAAGVSRVLLDNPNYVKSRAVLEDIELFDAAFFDINPREAEIMDPQHRLFLEGAWSALEDAGYNPVTYDGLIGVFASTLMSSYLLSNLYPNHDLLASAGALAIRIANDRDFLPMRASYKLNLKGPSFCVQTACSSSLVACHLACQSLLDFQCDIALVGGVSVSVPQKFGYVYQPGSIYSPDGHCRAFDADARGTVSGSGLGLVVLKRLQDALDDGDTIHAVIKGSAINNDGSLKVGYTAPSVQGQAEVIAAAQAAAHVQPDTIGYIEAHGTGTTLGDPVEIAALTQVFRERTAKQGFCAIGSLKTNIGHLDAAAGVAGLIKTVLALKHKQIPPSLNYETPNPEIDFANSPFWVVTEPTPWKPGSEPRRAGISSFAVGGTNAHIVLEEAPPQPDSTPAQPWQVLTLSAKTETALEQTTSDLLEHLRRQPDQNLADVAYTLQLGRGAFDRRRALVCRDVADAIDVLETRDPKRVFDVGPTLANPRVVFLFPGQGAQYANMGADLYQTEPTFRAEVDRCCALLKPHLGLDLRTILYPTPQQLESANQQIYQTLPAQSALFVVEYALAQLWIRRGVKPQAMIGHSIGEYVAACLAGVFSLEDALALVAARGRLMQQLPGGAMLTVPLPVSEIEPFLGPKVSLAAINGPALCVLSGTTDAIQRIETELKARAIDCRRLHTSHAFHSQMQDPILKAFGECISRVRFQPPQIPYLSNLSGTWITPSEATEPAYWVKHLRHTVRFSQGVTELLQQADQVFLEVGPGRTLSSLLRLHATSAGPLHTCMSMRHPQEDADDVAVLLSGLSKLWVAGAPIDWASLYTDQQRRRISLPTYPFARTRYWIDPPTCGSALAAPTPTAHKRTDCASWFYTPIWKEAPLVGSAPDESPASWIVFTTAHDPGQVLAEHLRKQSQSLIIVRPGDTFRQISPSEYLLAPNQPQDYHTLMAAVSAQQPAPTHIVHAWSFAEQAQTADGTLAVLGWPSVAWLTQALKEHPQPHPIHLTVLTEGIHDVTGLDLLRPEHAALLGFCQTLPYEQPGLTYRCIDLPGAQPGPRQAQAWADRLVAELTTLPAPSVIAYRGDRRWARTYESLRPAALTPGAQRVRAGGVYLLTDGSSSTGLALAEYLARTAQARLILTGTQPLPEQQIRSLEAYGAEILVLPADLADPRQAQELIARSQQRFGELHGVLYSPARLSADQGLDHLSGIIRELYTLAALLADQPLDFVLVYSPLTTFLGGSEQHSAASASAFLDAFVRQRSREGGVPWLRAIWDEWQAPTPESFAATSDQLTLTPDEGAIVLQHILATQMPTALIVSSADLDARREGLLPATSATPELAPKVQSLHGRPALNTVYVAPRTPLERGLGELWQELLGVGTIGINDNFFELGGHSLLATQVASRIRDQFGVELSLGDFFASPTLAEQAQAVAAAQQAQPNVEPPAIPKADRTGPIPLSFAQQQLWFLHQFDPANASYNMPFALQLAGSLNHEALAQSLDEIVRRHEMLRTTFSAIDGKPVQIIAPPAPVRLAEVDLTALPPEEQDATIQRLIAEEARRPFDLQQGPLLRVSLLRLRPVPSGHDTRPVHVLALTMHHIIADGWSLGVFVREIVELYAALAQGQPGAVLPELPIQYADYAIWQRRRLQEPMLEQQLAYWKQQLGTALPNLELPLARPQPQPQTQRSARHHLTLSPAISEALTSLSKREGATLFMTLLAAFKVLLHYYTRHDDIVVGTDIANRNRAETERLIGFFVNQLVLRTDLSGNPTFRELLSRVREVTLAAFDHQDVPFDRVVDAVKPERDLRRSPLFQIKFALQNLPPPLLHFQDLTLSHLEVANQTAKFDLFFNLAESEQGIIGMLEYNTDVFEAVAIVRMAAHYTTLLQQLVEQPELTLTDAVEFLAETDRQIQQLKAQQLRAARLEKFNRIKR